MQSLTSLPAASSAIRWATSTKTGSCAAGKSPQLRQRSQYLGKSRTNPANRAGAALGRTVYLFASEEPV
jgi:hypothetical protein